MLGEVVIVVFLLLEVVLSHWCFLLAIDWRWRRHHSLIIPPILAVE